MNESVGQASGVRQSIVGRDGQASCCGESHDDDVMIMVMDDR